MTKEQILAKVDELRLLILLSEPTSKPDEERFQDWLDKLMGRHLSGYDPYEVDSRWVTVNRKYSEYQTTRSLVEDLYHRRHGDKPEYHRDRDKIRRIVAEVIAMVMFIQEEKEK